MPWEALPAKVQSVFRTAVIGAFIVGLLVGVIVAEVVAIVGLA